MYNVKAIGNLFFKTLSLDFVQNVLTLSGGVLFAQGIVVLTAPLVTRLFVPETFGILAMFLLVADMITSISSLSYDRAIVLPKEDSKAANLLSLSFLLVCFFSLSSLLIALFWRNAISGIFGAPELVSWLTLLPLAVFVGGTLRVLNSWSIRGRLFKHYAASNIIEAGSATFIKIALGLLIGASAGVLICSNLLGVIFALLFLYLRVMRQDVSRTSQEISTKKMKQVALEYKKFPYYSSPNSLLLFLSQNIVVFLFGYFFTPTVVGFYYLGRRILATPIIVLSLSVHKVYFQKASAQNASGGDILKGFEKTTLGLAGIGILPFGILTLFAPAVFSIIFGQAWVETGRYVQVLSPMFFLNFLSSPSAAIYDILQKQHIRLIISISHNLCRMGAITAGYFMTQKAISCLALYSSVGILFASAHVALAYGFLRKEQLSRKSL